MSSLVGLFHKYNSSPVQLLKSLEQFLEHAVAGSPVPVKCTKRIYNAVIKHVDLALGSGQHDSLCILLQSLSYIAKGSNAPATGFHKFVAFGLPEKIKWCDCLCTRCESDCESWNKAVDELFFTITVILDYSDEVKENMVVLIPRLLTCICNDSLSCVSRIEATRAANGLLEVSDMEERQALSARREVASTVKQMGHKIVPAGDFELQVAMVECLFRVTSIEERRRLGELWFTGHSPKRAFSDIRESEFETDCRTFLNLLNESAGNGRSVYSLPCKTAVLGTHELHRPSDEGLLEFWVDFNAGSLSLFVDDPSASEGGMWETVVIRTALVAEWTIGVLKGDFRVVVTLTEPSHTLLPSLSPSTSHSFTIIFPGHSDPTCPLQSVFPGKQNTRVQERGRPVPQASPASSMKASAVITPIFLSSKKNSTASPLAVSAHGKSLRLQQHLQEISPIDVPPNTPAVGGHLSSQGSATPPNQPIPLCTPHTSTPKARPQLQFVGNGAVRSRKTSEASSSIHLSSGRNTRVVRKKSQDDSVARRLSDTSGSMPPPSCNGLRARNKEGRSISEPNETVRKLQSSLTTSRDKPPPAPATSRDKPPPAPATSRDKPPPAPATSRDKPPPAPATSRDKPPPAPATSRDKQLTSQNNSSAHQRIGNRPTTEMSDGTSEQMTEVPISWTPGQSPVVETSTNQNAGNKRTVVTSVQDSQPANSGVNQREPENSGVNQREPENSGVNQREPENSGVNQREPENSGVNQRKPKSKRLPLNDTAGRKTKLNTSVGLKDITNELNVSNGAQKRVFNLSACPTGNGGRNTGKRRPTKNKAKPPPKPSVTQKTLSTFDFTDTPTHVSSVRTARPRPPSLDSTLSSIGQDIDAIPDSMPATDCHNTSKKRRPPLSVPKEGDSFSFDSDRESDASWVITTKPPPSRSKGTSGQQKTLLSNSRTQKSTRRNATRVKGGSAAVPATKEKYMDHKRDGETSRNTAVGVKDGDRKDCTKYTDGKTDRRPSRRTAAGGSGGSSVIAKMKESKIDGTPDVSSPQEDLRKRKAAATSLFKTPALEFLSEGNLPTPVPKATSRRDRSSKRPLVIDDSPLDATPATKRCRQTRLSIGYFSLPSVSPTSASEKEEREEREEKEEREESPQCQESPQGQDYSQSQDCSQGQEVGCVPPPVTISPSSTLLSSQVEADINITAGFQEICKDLLARAGGKIQPTGNRGTKTPANSRGAKTPASSRGAKTPASSRGSKPANSRGSKPPSSDRKTPWAIDMSPEADKSEGEQSCDHITLTQLSKQIVSSNKSRPARGAQKTTGKKGKPPKTPKTNKRQPLATPTPVLVTTSPPVELEDLDLSLPSLSDVLETPAVSEKTAGNRKRKVLSPECSEFEDDVSIQDVVLPSPPKLPRVATPLQDQSMNVSGEMKALMSAFGTGLSNAVKSKRSRIASFTSCTSKSTSGHLRKLWQEHQRQRSKVLSAFHDQLSCELGILEEDMKQTQNSEEQAMTHFKEQIRNLTTSRKTQHKQVGRLQALQLSLHEQLGALEAQQIQQKDGVQKSLKKEMQQMQKKLLGESQKQEMQRLKQTLHGMLMRV